MKEFMFIIRNKINHQDSWSREYFDDFLRSCQFYIEGIKKDGKLISAQPLLKEGRIISGTPVILKNHPLTKPVKYRSGIITSGLKILTRLLKLRKEILNFPSPPRQGLKYAPSKRRKGLPIIYIQTRIEYPELAVEVYLI